MKHILNMNISAENLARVLFAGCLVFSLWGCGGGSNDSSNNDGAAIFMNVNMDNFDGDDDTPDSDFVPIEMVLSTAPSTGFVTVTLSSAVPESNINETVKTVQLESYRITYERLDGGAPSLPPIEFPFSAVIDLLTSQNQEIILVDTDQKIFSDFAQEFFQTFEQTDFDGEVTVTGTSLAGQRLSDSTNFRARAGVFGDLSPLLPTINNFNEPNALTLGDQYLASWFVSGVTSQGVLFLPWGDEVFLDGSRFPGSFFSFDTNLLSDRFNSTTTLPRGVLQVQNLFGAIGVNPTDNAGSQFVLSVPDSSEGPVTIEQFFPNLTEIEFGQSVTMTWVVSGGPIGLELLPDTYNDVTVNFDDKDLTFDSVTVVPHETVRPILKARNNTRTATAFLSDTITVNSTTVGGPVDPVIEFFTASSVDVPVNSQVAFFWNVTGDVAKLELFPIQGDVLDVTGRQSLFTPPLSRLGENPFTLVATGINGTVVTANLNVNVTNTVGNQPVVIENIVVSPSSNILNGTQGAVSFRVNDPERADSSWRVRKIAGDRVTFTPLNGQIPNGLGEASFAFVDQEDLTNGFITFELSAYDDVAFGTTQDTTRDIELITFNTAANTGVVNEPPEITGLTFTPGGGSGGLLLPGQDGVLSFTISDPDSSDIIWRAEIVSGDRGGTLNGFTDSVTGTIRTGVGDVAIQYQDDPDATSPAVVFQITATEASGENPLSDVALIRVEFLEAGDRDILFQHIGLYNEGNNGAPGTVIEANRLAFFVNYLVPNVADPATSAGQFFIDQNNPASIVPSMSTIVDVAHGTADPGQIASVDFLRNFVSPATDPENESEMLFSGYFLTPGAQGGPGAGVGDPPQDGVSRWYFSFNVESFRSDTGTIYNLPTSDGFTRDYQIDITATDQDGASESVPVSFRVQGRQ